MLDGIDVVVWDFDGVINRNYDESGFLWSRDLERDFALTVSAVHSALFGEAWRSVLSGKLGIHDLLAGCLPSLGYAGTPQSFLDYWMERDFHIDHEVIAIMKRLRAMGKVQAIGTNNEPVRTDLLWTKYEMNRICDHLFSSSHLGIAKPDREFYAVVQNAFGIPPHRLLLIDDTPKNTEGARNAGWQGLPYGDYSRGQSGNASELTKALGLA
jgi:putative hydrolase of the HAD superfamily